MARPPGAGNPGSTSNQSIWNVMENRNDGGGQSPWILPVAAGAAAVAVAARASVPLPGTPVPVSLQTLAVVVVGGLLGLRRGTVALLTYLALGAVGLPVFADGASGAEHLAGPTGGYLVGFVGGAALAGWWADAGHASRLPPATVGMILAQAVILAAGWTRLAAVVGGGEAWRSGVEPFLVGAALKAVAGGAVLVAAALVGAGRAGRREGRRSGG